MPLYSAEMTRVAIEITQAETGCDLPRTHEGLLPDFAGRMEDGWVTILGRLAGETA